MDAVSSIVVLWRFFAPMSVDEAVNRKLLQREKRADVAIGMVIFILGLSIFIAAMTDFAGGPEPLEELAGIFTMSFLSMFVFAVLSCFKFHYAVRLDSPSLFKDGICSLIGTVLSISLFVNTLIIAATERAWWIDPFVAMLAGIFALIYGARATYVANIKEKLPIYSVSWWCGTNKESTDEASNSHRGPNVELPPTNFGDDNEHDML